MRGSTYRIGNLGWGPAKQKIRKLLRLGDGGAASLSAPAMPFGASSDASVRLHQNRRARAEALRFRIGSGHVAGAASIPIEAARRECLATVQPPNGRDAWRSPFAAQRVNRICPTRPSANRPISADRMTRRRLRCRTSQSHIPPTVVAMPLFPGSVVIGGLKRIRWSRNWFIATNCAWPEPAGASLLRLRHSYRQSGEFVLT